MQVLWTHVVSVITRQRNIYVLNAFTIFIAR